MNPAWYRWGAWLLALMIAAASSKATAQPTNSPAPPATNPAPAAPAPATAESPTRGLNESVFRIIGERNIFNANRSGGQVRLPSQRPSRVEYFTLVGTMAYEKGVFAFFDGSSSEFTKALKASGVIAGHKLADIYASSVKLEADGKEIDLPVGSQMRREDEGTWHVSESHGGGNGYASSRDGDSSSRDSSGRNNRSDRSRNGDRSRREDSSRSRDNAGSVSRPSSETPSSSPDPDVLKRLMERREKESP